MPAAVCRLRLLRLLDESAAAGLICAILVVVGGALLLPSRARGPVRQAVETSETAPIVTVSLARPPVPSALEILNHVLVAPVVETLLFLLLYWVLHPRREFSLCTIAYIVIMGAAGFLLHGASLATVNRILPFALLAGLFARWAHRCSLGHAFAATGFAHAVWNAILLIIYFARRGWA